MGRATAWSMRETMVEQDGKNPGQEMTGFYRLDARARKNPPHGSHEAIMVIRTGDDGQTALYGPLEAIVPSTPVFWRILAPHRRFGHRRGAQIWTSLCALCSN